MLSRKLLTSTLLWIALALPSTGCAPKVMAPSLLLVESDRRAADDPKRPEIAHLAPPSGTGAAERGYLFEQVIKPLLQFSLDQEATTAAERQRAEGVVAKADAFNLAVHPRRRKILGVF